MISARRIVVTWTEGDPAVLASESEGARRPRIEARSCGPPRTLPWLPARSAHLVCPCEYPFKRPRFRLRRRARRVSRRSGQLARFQSDAAPPRAPRTGAVVRHLARMLVNGRTRSQTSAAASMSPQRSLDGSMQPLWPVGRDPPGGSRRWLIQWVMLGRRKPRPVVELLVAVVIEPLFSRFETGDQRMPGGFGVGGSVLARRIVAAADVAALGASTEVKPPSLVSLAFEAPCAAGRDGDVDACLFGHPSHATRPRELSQSINLTNTRDGRKLSGPTVSPCPLTGQSARRRKPRTVMRHFLV
jgi:hypothetical protein